MNEDNREEILTHIDENIDNTDFTDILDNFNGKEVSKDAYHKEIEELWNTIGFHRITGGFFYGYILMIGGAAVGIGTVGIIAAFLPFPEINGYAGMVGALLGTWFGLMDFNLGGGGGLSGGLNRFIGQYADTDPERSLKYINFYVWFQMFSGLLQITVLSIVCFTFFINDVDFSFLTWFILGKTMIQYPGMLMVMESALQSFQRGDRNAVLSWLQDTVFQVTVNILFLIWGRNFGKSHPEFGMLMSITFFYILSQFCDDWINFFVGGMMFNKVLRQRGVDVGVWAILVPNFDKAIIKEALIFTGKQWIGMQINGIIGYIISLWVLREMGGYATWQGLLLIPNFMAHLVVMGGPLSGAASPAISEAYNNGKKELTRYFLHDLLKWISFITIFMLISLVVIIPKALNSLVEILNLENYAAGISWIPIIMFTACFEPFQGLWSKWFVSCDQPMPPIYVGYMKIPLDYTMKFLFIYLCIQAEILHPLYYFILPGFISKIVGAIVGFTWFQRSVIKIQYRKIFWQAFGAPIVAGFFYYFILTAVVYAGWPLIEIMFSFAGEDIATVIAAVIFLLGAIFLFPALIFCPLFGFLGGFDSFTLEEFRKTALLSGPSKFLVMFMYKATKKFAVGSKYTEKHPIADYVLIAQQVQELVDEGKANKLQNM